MGLSFRSSSLVGNRDNPWSATNNGNTWLMYLVCIADKSIHDTKWKTFCTSPIRWYTYFTHPPKWNVPLTFPPSGRLHFTCFCFHCCIKYIHNGFYIMTFAFNYTIIVDIDVVSMTTSLWSCILVKSQQIRCILPLLEEENWISLNIQENGRNHGNVGKIRSLFLSYWSMREEPCSHGWSD